MKRVDASTFRQWLDRRQRQGPAAEVQRQVRTILAAVAEAGDEAVIRWTRQLDGVELAGPPALERERLKEAWERLGEELRRALAVAAQRIELFHRRQRPVDFVAQEEDGTALAQRWIPLQRAAVYAPGGRAAYPSSVLMGVIPARVAGVAEIWVATPPGADGLPPREMMAAAYLAGADKLLPVGGVQALGALAYGTQTVPAVDIIVGPGNAYVQEAKRQLFGTVAIDALYGPSELAVLVAGEAEPAWVAADLLAQVEHAPDNLAVLVGVDEDQLQAILAQVEQQSAVRQRRQIIQQSLADLGRAVACRDLEQALALVEELAPEHLMLVGQDAEALAPQVRSAGALFVGANSPVALGDYVAGTNHCLPTGGTARFASALGTLNFMRRMAVAELSAGACRRLAGPGAVMADAEGFEAHAHSLRLRQEPGSGTEGGEAHGSV